VIPDPATRLVVYCELGRISTFAVATLREMGFMRAAALEGGVAAWSGGGWSLVSGR
jgi:rhodanese-related sulfurtransferase